MPSPLQVLKYKDDSGAHFKGCCCYNLFAHCLILVGKSWSMMSQSLPPPIVFNIYAASFLLLRAVLFAINMQHAGECSIGRKWKKAAPKLMTREIGHVLDCHALPRLSSREGEEEEAVRVVRCVRKAF